VVYKCRFLGAVDVKDPKGMNVVKGAIDRLKLVTETMRTAGVKIKDCDLAISISAVTATDTLTKNILQSHSLHQISFSADDRRSRGNIFAYIAKPVPKSKEHTCYVYETEEHKAEEIVTTIGQAFEIAFQRFKESKKAQEDFKALKAGLQTPAEKEAFAKKLADVQKQVTEMERESAMPQRRKPPLQKQPSAIAKWENITHALQPFTQEPSMDPGTQYLVPRPETKELDGVISQMDSKISELEEGFSRPMSVINEEGNEEELVMSQYVMENIEGHVKSMQLESDQLEEPNLPANYQMEEYIKAR